MELCFWRRQVKSRQHTSDQKSDQKGTQNVFVLFLDQMLRHCSKRTALIITFISLSEHTVAAKLKQTHEGQDPASVHPGDCCTWSPSYAVSYTGPTPDNKHKQHKQSVHTCVKLLLFFFLLRKIICFLLSVLLNVTGWHKPCPHNWIGWVRGSTCFFLFLLWSDLKVAQDIQDHHVILCSCQSINF